MDGCRDASTGCAAVSCSGWPCCWSSGIGKLLGGTGSDIPTRRSRPAPASAQQQEPEPSRHASGPVAPSKAAAPEDAGRRSLPPSGECRDDEVSVLPSVPHAWGLQPIVIRLALAGPAAGVHLQGLPGEPGREDHQRRGPDLVEPGLPRGDPDDRVVVRSSVPTHVNVTWNGRRSDDRLPARRPTGRCRASTTCTPPRSARRRPTCSSRSPGRPTQVVTKTAKPQAEPAPSPSAKSRRSAKSSPSATVSGKQSKCGGDNVCEQLLRLLLGSPGFETRRSALLRRA